MEEEKAQVIYWFFITIFVCFVFSLHVLICYYFLLFSFFACFHFFFFFFFLLCFAFSFYFWLKKSFSHMKRLVLANCFACFFVYLFVLFLDLKFYGKNSHLHCFSPVSEKFTRLFIYYYFNTTLHFILSLTIFFF